MPGWILTRLPYLVLAIGTIMVGLIVHERASGIDARTRDIVGDALWAMMMTWWVSAVRPQARLWRRGVVALAISVAVELSQLYRAPWIDAARSTRLGSLVLGTGFDPRDLASYTFGVLAAMLLDRFLSRGRMS
jgi:hypothetical protein